ncbi:hypothetical protein RvY_02347 [Ramazzottius varieornatus]|uniref:Protein kinase domain-containing protein n=1 Tax=Ramazzottius varieornatus TaxID=947166 RepID=A0A1D1UN61_RAMVA|nr:hypothetical protein RvY_02347 [Ramazzottius varieornatus]
MGRGNCPLSGHVYCYKHQLYEDEIRVMLKTGQHQDDRRPPFAHFVNLLNTDGDVDCLGNGDSGCSVHPEFRRSSTASSTISKFMEKDLSTKNLMSFSYQAWRGLAHLSSRSIIHRDIAARNVLITKNRTVKIWDFGMAKVREKDYILTNTAQVRGLFHRDSY